MYIVYELDPDTGVHEIARINGAQVYGPEAEKVRRLLIENGWPKKPAHWALYGDYLWAAKVKEPIIPDDGEQVLVG